MRSNLLPGQLKVHGVDPRHHGSQWTVEAVTLTNLHHPGTPVGAECKLR